MREKRQCDLKLFDLKTSDDKSIINGFPEWSGMPEFVQEKKEPYKKLIVRFETKDDYENFARLINQNLTPKTKSIWVPFKPHRREERKVWK